MTKPRGVQWLEQTTGQTLERLPLSGDGARHLSLRVPDELYRQLEQLAAARGESVSHTARRLIADGIAAAEHPDRGAIDTAIAVLERLRRSS